MNTLKIQPGEYEWDQNDGNLFHSKICKEFTIRTRFATRAKTKDEGFVSTSLPHMINNETIEYLLAAVPQLATVKFDTVAHELLLTKSGASMWSDIQQPLLTFLFAHLYKVYGWKFEKQEVLMSFVPNPDVLSFELRVEMSFHTNLMKRLMFLPGIIKDDIAIDIIDYGGEYDFHIMKAPTFTWEELLPAINKVFAEYFVKGITLKKVPSRYINERNSFGDLEFSTM